ncbi:MAG TPA: type II toxin-antitoxin system Phd/YefM family antitoxin [Candidatus Binataceae bacterium]|nr:type II toxin-antitoxin system Phd/YefM family antitoxin [Candidatus Binataceae bacterium]
MMTTMTRMTTMHHQAHGRGTWAAAEAKARFSEVIDRALADGPQTITRKGQKAVVVVSAAEWQRKTNRKGNLAEFFAASPLRGSDLKIKRSKDGPREIEL